LVEYGFDYSMMQDATPVSGVALDTHIKGIYSWSHTVVWTAAHLCFAVLAALWPAFRAGRLEAVDSLRAG
jgi:ABC-type lipoprotein release transport system permease subunit